MISLGDNMFAEFLMTQARLHPAMQPRDAVKMCFQAAFGAEHAAPDRERAGAYLRSELNSLAPNSALAAFEPISHKIVRVNLAAWKAAKLPADWLLNMFLDTHAPGEDFPTLLKEAERAAGEGTLPFSAEEWNSFISAYPVDCPHPVHHSDAYRAVEAPAYRIVSAENIYLFPLLEKMAALPGGVIAVDGRAAAGKSSLADRLARITGAGVVHMDDFFLPPEKRSPERLNTPGGNVDHERFAAEVLPHLRSPESFTYPCFDCSVMSINGSREVTASPWRIVEGAYSHHPALGSYMDIRVFRTVPPEEQLRRILSRNGHALARRFENEWIPMEERYFSHFNIEENSDIII